MKFIGSLSLLFVALLATLTNAQDDSQDYYLHNFLMKSEYVHEVMFRLLLAHLNRDVESIPEPMQFNNFTYDHEFLFREGISHTYNPLLWGFTQSTFHVHVNNETKEANINMKIPHVNLTGTYDSYIEYFSIFPGSTIYRGAGEYEHNFYNVEVWINLTVAEDSGRTRPMGLKSSIEFSRCTLWAENFGQSTPWTADKWAEQSLKFKNNYDEEAPYTDLLLSETAASYFGTFWGFLNLDVDTALQVLLNLDSGNYPAPSTTQTPQSTTSRWPTFKPAKN